LYIGHNKWHFAIEFRSFNCLCYLVSVGMQRGKSVNIWKEAVVTCL